MYLCVRRSRLRFKYAKAAGIYLLISSAGVTFEWGGDRSESKEGAKEMAEE